MACSTKLTRTLSCRVIGLACSSAPFNRNISGVEKFYCFQTTVSGWVKLVQKLSRNLVVSGWVKCTETQQEPRGRN